MKKKIKQKPDYRRINELRQYLFDITSIVETLFLILCVFITNYESAILACLLLHVILLPMNLYSIIKKSPFLYRNKGNPSPYRVDAFLYSGLYFIIGCFLLTINIVLAVIQFIICGAMVIAFILLGFRNQIRRWYLKKKEEKRLANKNK